MELLGSPELEYPVVHVSAREAALLCEAEGKRLCDAHEWEGACAGAVRPAEDEYDFRDARPLATASHNRTRPGGAFSRAWYSSW